MKFKIVQKTGDLEFPASAFGFLPTATASENVTAWNSFPCGIKIIIDIPGIYDINGTLYCCSNTIYEFVAGCTIRKTGIATTYTHVLANKGILTSERDENITITGNGLIISVNGIDDYSSAAAYRMRGQINFYKVDNLTLDNIYNSDNGISQFFGHFADIATATITDMTCLGSKDGLHWHKCSDIIIDGLTTDTTDDALAFMVSDYNTITPCVGDIRRVTITNWHNSSTLHTGGSAVRISCSSWANWTTSTSYKLGDICVNAGNIYIKSSAGTQTSSNAPVHTSGKVTGADSIEWDWMQSGSITEGIISDITIKDPVFAGSDPIVNFSCDDDTYMRAVFPGTQGNAYLENFILDNVTWTPTVNNHLVTVVNNLKSLTIRNTVLDISAITGDVIVATNGIITSGLFCETINIENCNLKVRSGSYVIHTTASHPVTTLNVTNSTIDLNGICLIPGQTQSLTVNLTTTELIHLDNLISAGIILSATINCNYVTYTDPVRILYYDRASGNVHFNSNHGIFTEPTGTALWYATNAGLLTINVTNSTGTITQSKIADLETVVTACDLFTHLYVYGETYQGGIVVYIANNRTSARVVKDIALTASVWGCAGTLIGGTSQNVGTGQANTIAVMGGCATAGIPARLCDAYNDGTYSDYYLPSLLDFMVVYTYRAYFSTLFSANYWTSSEWDQDMAFYVNPVTGYGDATGKLAINRCMPMRDLAL